MVIPRAISVVIEAGKVLVVKRYVQRQRADECVMCEVSDAPGPDCAGHHYAVLPGGHVEEGETPEETAVRELAEETTLTAEIDRLLWTGTHNGRPAYYFLMKDVRGDVQLSGPELDAQSVDNSFELLWRDVESLEALGIHPPEIPARLLELRQDR
ncbi:NUDIX domain-containing protein [Kribbella antibiotica]|nr:NUDIX domain-containing protein [Kribbella antibiotica]